MSRNPTIWLVVILLIVLLFGSSKLPDLARSVGQSLKILKKEVGDLRDEDKPAASTAAPTAAAPSPAPVVVTPPSAETGPTAGTGDVPPAEGGTPPRA
ncbi:Sec-independent protein translocase protein TatA [Flavimobilis marinus]|uniref:Sec-independent protein translocase protein TatA n=1 Tax=Flavimobilis marinus TaxID=285351 RepID=A0A1I2FCG5_9MICO|nr:twin-arginine translocase TatA/TatE family subunit [Flavimobilis marinus]GHG52493.1 Sec-independent protein translocase protein TatA [Flavimobilis marinus]SFF02448.1 sec-independent protein translocase protein TatA [Flavimobilis marinus]